jgi:hypothetical protein
MDEDRLDAVGRRNEQFQHNEHVCNDIHSYLANGLSDVPFNDRYYISSRISSTYYNYKARPVVGGEWSAMAVQGKPLRLYKA